MSKLVANIFSTAMVPAAFVVLVVMSVSCGGGNDSGQTGKAGTETGMETLVNDDGGVSVSVTPLDLSETAPTWDFRVVLNTHTKELGEDMAEVSVLVDAGGREYRPVAWEGAPPGGHHREGVLKFSPVSPKPASLQLVIRKVGGVEERSFKWAVP